MLGIIDTVQACYGCRRPIVDCELGRGDGQPVDAGHLVFFRVEEGLRCVHCFKFDQHHTLQYGELILCRSFQLGDLPTACQPPAWWWKRPKRGTHAQEGTIRDPKPDIPNPPRRHLPLKKEGKVNNGIILSEGNLNNTETKLAQERRRKSQECNLTPG